MTDAEAGSLDLPRAAWRACTAGPRRAPRHPAFVFFFNVLYPMPRVTTRATGRRPPRAAACSCDGQRSEAGGIRAGGIIDDVNLADS